MVLRVVDPAECIKIENQQQQPQKKSGKDMINTPEFHEALMKVMEAMNNKK